MTQDDALFRYRVRLFGLAKEIGVRAACRGVGVHHSSYYRWKSQVDRFGLEILRPRGRRRPRMANQTSPFVEQKVVAFALGHPGFGPARISAELRRDKWGGIVLSPNGVHRVPSSRILQRPAKPATGSPSSSRSSRYRRPGS